MSELAKVGDAIEAPKAAADPLEDIARSHGWKPEAEWKGDPPENGFKSADDFIRDGFAIQGKQHDKIERLQGTVERVESNITEMAKGEAKRTKVALEKQKDRLELERQEAFDEQDSDKFNAVDKELTETHEQLKEIEVSPEDQAFIDGEEAFKKRNEWYGDDMVMTNDVESLANTIGKFHKGLSPDEFYDKLESAIKKKHPDQFRNLNRDKGGMVSGDSPRSKQGKGKGFDSMPQEAKEAWEEVSQYSSISQEDYAKAHFEQE